MPDTVSISESHPIKEFINSRFEVTLSRSLGVGAFTNQKKKIGKEGALPTPENGVRRWEDAVATIASEQRLRKVR
jgi:hypothetical protein